MALSPAMTKLKKLIQDKNLALKTEQDGKTLGLNPGQLPQETSTPAMIAPVELVKEGAEVKVRASEKLISYNEKQQEFINKVLSGQSTALIGPAGTGKTTATKGAILSLIQSGKVSTLNVLNHKYLTIGRPGIICTSFTNKAVENMKKVLPADLRANCLTIHKLLEYGPVYDEVYDETTGKYKTVQRFEPFRNAKNTLGKTISTIIIDEASMVPTDLWNKLVDAIPEGHKVQIILIFDLQQLPPVFGRSIAIHSLVAGIPFVELTDVYRQALESPIIELAHRILSGKVIPAPELDSWNKETPAGKLTFKPWKKALSYDVALKVMGDFIPKLIEAGEYNPVEDCILMPFNKADTFGCVEVNKLIASYLAKSTVHNPERHPVHEIIAGFEKKYFRVGDKVLWNKTEHFIKEIKPNNKYIGEVFKPASVTMDYEGNETDVSKSSMLAEILMGAEMTDAHLLAVDSFLDSFADLGKEERVNQASHVITVYSEEYDSFEEINTAGGVNQLSLGYAMTVHKSQGSEYPRVILLTHHTHATMLFRELVYTGVTRAAKELLVICPPNLFVKGITSQRLPGKTVMEKVESFERYMKLNKVGDDEKPNKLYLLVAA